MVLQVEVPSIPILEPSRGPLILEGFSERFQRVVFLIVWNA